MYYRILSSSLNMQKISFVQKNFNIFSSAKKYTPLMPLTGVRSLLFSQKQYSQGKFPALRGMFFWGIPSFAIAINNYLTEWNLMNGVGFGFVFLAGMIIQKITQWKISHEVQSFEASSDLQTFYLSLPKTRKVQKLLAKNFKTHSVLKLIGQIRQVDEIPNFSFYIPIEANRLTSVQSHLQLQRMLILMQKKVCIFQIDRTKDISKISFQLTANQEKQFSVDKQRLSQQELFKKYEDKTIIIQTNAPDFYTQKKVSPRKFVFKLNMKNNKQKKYQDYLMGLALGYQITPQIIKQSPKSEKKQTNQKQKHI